MAKTILELKAERQEKRTAYEALLKVTEGENARKFTDDERIQMDTFERELDEIDDDIADAERQSIAKKRLAQRSFTAEKKGTPEEQVRGKYNILKAIGSQSNVGEKLEGVEKEMHDEAVNEARDAGRTIKGLGLPAMFMQKRDLTVGTAATAGNLVQDTVQEMIPALRPRLTIQEMGATVMTGLTDNIDFPRGTTVSAATWEGETDAAAETTPATELLSLRPKRLAAFTDVTKQLILQTKSVDAQSWALNELSRAVAQAVEVAAINGSGTPPVPEGITNMTNLNVGTGATNGIAPTRAALIELEELVATANADVDNMGFLTTPGARGFLKNLQTDAGSGLFVWDAQNTLLGYKAMISNNVPSDLVKGSSGAVCHAIIFANWAELIVAQWGGVDLLVNPYTRAKEGIVEIVVNSYWDVGGRHEQSFAAILDALV